MKKIVFLFSLALVSAAYAAPLDHAKLAKIDDAVNADIAAGRIPGAVVWVEHQGDIYAKAYGKRSLVPTVEDETLDTIFDVASISKVMGGTPAIMKLYEEGKVDLDASITNYLPEYTNASKDTLRNLLTHTSGFPPDISTHPVWHGADTAIKMAAAAPLRYPPGSRFQYSDVNLFTVGEIVHRVSGLPLDEFDAKYIYGPLKMIDTGYKPPASKIPRIAPTQMVDANGESSTSPNGIMLRGTVHDPTSRFMGGVAGHAGVFTTAADMARYARMMLNMGELDGVRIFKPETVKLFTTMQANLPGGRALGWDVNSAYASPRGSPNASHFPLGSFGHTGFTGCAFWIDPYSKTFFIFLSNHVHPYGGSGNVVPLYRQIGTIAASAVTDFDWSTAPGEPARATTPAPPAKTNAAPAAPSSGGAGADGADTMEGAGSMASDPTATPRVLEGIDVLEKENFAPLKGLRIGLITNPTGQDGQRRSTIDLLTNVPGVQLKMLFSPEHGLYGNFDSPVRDGVDQHTGLPVYSLYGSIHAPTLEQMKQIDALVFDIQDVGCRFYTYTSTLGLCLEAANKGALKFFVLDRVNPINGLMIDGPVRNGRSSFVAYYVEPVRYALTEGELATMYKAESNLDKVDLTVIKLQGWDRSMWFDQTGLPWINPSPNMRSATEEILYPGVGLLESTHVSLGRGTPTPFELIGAPYIEEARFADAMNAEGLPGVHFDKVRFTPTSSVDANQECGGVRITLTDRDRCRVCDIGLLAAKILNRWYPQQFGVTRMTTLLVDPATLQAIQADKSLSEIREMWVEKTDEYKARRAKYLLYAAAPEAAH